MSAPKACFVLQYQLFSLDRLNKHIAVCSQQHSGCPSLQQRACPTVYECIVAHCHRWLAQITEATSPSMCLWPLRQTPLLGTCKTSSGAALELQRQSSAAPSILERLSYRCVLASLRSHSRTAAAATVLTLPGPQPARLAQG